MNRNDLRDAARRAPTPRIRTSFRRAFTRRAIQVMPIPRVAGVTVRTSRFAGVPVRVYRPTGTGGGSRDLPALVWIHGGGFVIGHPRQDDRLCKTVAAELGCVVLSPDYRRAPRHPFPAAHDDCLKVWHSVHERAEELDIDPTNVALGGQSAGGGIAFGMALRLRDQGGPMPRSLWTFAPMIDDRTASRRELDSADHPVWDNVRNHFGWRSYLGVEPGADTVTSYAAPARAADLSGLPNTWIGVGDRDLFHAEDVDFAARLQLAGSKVALACVVDGFHGFESLAVRTAAARAFLDGAMEWLRSQARPSRSSLGPR